MKRVIVLGLVLCGLLSGCAWRTQIERSMVSTRKLDFSKKHTVDRSKKVKGSHRAHSVWIIPLGSPDAGEAVEQTIFEVNRNTNRRVVGLADANVKFRFLYLWLYSQRWYDVEGYPVYEE